MFKKLLRKKNKNKPVDQQKDFTIDTCANAFKIFNRAKKSSAIEVVAPDLTWDQIADDDVEVVIEHNGDRETVSTDNKIQITPKNKCSNVQTDEVYYPEIVWYLISDYIRPEWVGTFARINKHTYAITKCQSFWRKMYNRYCNKYLVPDNLKLENDYKSYALRQRVIRALYHSYGLFVESNILQSEYSIGQDKRPYELIKLRCISMWFKKKGSMRYNIYFKFKKTNSSHTVKHYSDFLTVMDRIDANDEENCKILQVSCECFGVLQPAMIGLTLATVNISLMPPGLRSYKLVLGFTTNPCNISRTTIPEHEITIHVVTRLRIFDWWHPEYPHDQITPIPLMPKEDRILRRDFFA